MKQNKLIWGCLLILIALMTGCANKDKPPEPVTIKIVVDNKLTFTNYETIIRSKFPHVTLEVVDGYQAYTFQKDDDLSTSEKMQEASQRAEKRVHELIMKENPDMFYQIKPDALPPSFGALDLEPFITRDKYPLSKVQQNLVEQDRVRLGGIKGLSPTFDRDVLFINRKLFQALNIPEPDDNMNWEQFRHTAARFSNQQVNHETVFGYTLKTSAWDTLLSLSGNMNGMQFYDANGKLLLDQPAWIERSKELVEDYKDGIMMARGRDYKAFNIEEMKKVAMFVGKYRDLAMLMGRNEGAEDWRVTAMPSDSRNPLPTPYESKGLYSINRASKHIEQAWEIVKYLNSTEAAPLIAPTLTSMQLMTHVESTPANGFNLDAFMDGAATPPTEQRKPIYSISSQINFMQVIDEEFNKVIQDDKTLEEAISEIIEQSKIVLERNDQSESSMD